MISGLKIQGKLNYEIGLVKSITQLGYKVKRIKMRPDRPGKMGLTDPYPWVEQKASPSPA